MPGDLTPLAFAKFIISQLFYTMPIPTKSFAGQTVIVTGSNTGLGLEAVRHIVALKAAKVIIAVRSVEKGEVAKKSVEESTKCGPGVIEVWRLDLGSYESVKEFAARASKDLPRIDLLLENAAVAMTRWEMTEDNETSITINVVSTFLLAYLLLPKLKETANKYNVRPVLTIVNSDVHSYVDFKQKTAPEGIFNHLNKEANANLAEIYPVSKLLGVYVVHEMVEQRPVDTYPITINMVNPGLCSSELAREGTMDIKIMKFFLARTTEAGSRTLVHGASAGPETHGEFLSSCQITPTASVTKGPEGLKAQKRVYAELMDKMNKIVPGVSDNL